MSIRVYTAQPVLPGAVPGGQTVSRNRPVCAANCGRVLVDRSPGHHHQLPISRLGNAYYHTAHLPGQTWTQLVIGGISATVAGICGGIRRHPVKSALLGLALVGGAYCAAKLVAASAADFHTFCLQDASKQLWCVTKKVTESATDAVFERYETVKHWVHSGDFAQRTYDQLKGGAEVVLDVTKKYFVENPFKKIF
jgi:hypothetical protein